MAVPGTRRLEIYVAAHCPGWVEARRLAGEAAVRFPDLHVRVVDLEDAAGEPPPDHLVAVPTYVLDGQVISLGNPAPERLVARLEPRW